MDENDYMNRALQLALRGKGKTSPNPLVGALIVKNNRIIAEGWHKRCGSDHAEIVALKKAGRSTKGARLFVTLEPCFHYGRTPPCVDQIIKSGIKEIVIGMKDPNHLTNGRSIKKLKNSGMKVKVGFIQKKLAAINEAFLKYIKKKMPFVITKSAMTLDGKIATVTGQSKWITSNKTRKFARQLRNDFDAILVGVQTVLKDDPSLNCADRSKKMKKIILDSTLRMPKNAKLFQGVSPNDCYIAVTSEAPKARQVYFHQKGVNIICCPSRKGQVNMTWLMKYLAKQEINSILIEGGATVIGQALKEKLVDKMHIYIAPKVMGDHRARSAINGLKLSNVNQAIKLKKVELTTIGEDFFIQGYV